MALIDDFFDDLDHEDSRLVEYPPEVPLDHASSDEIPDSSAVPKADLRPCGYPLAPTPIGTPTNGSGSDSCFRAFTFPHHRKDLFPVWRGNRPRSFTSPNRGGRAIRLLVPFGRGELRKERTAGQPKIHKLTRPRKDRREATPCRSSRSLPRSPSRSLPLWDTPGTPTHPPNPRRPSLLFHRTRPHY